MLIEKYPLQILLIESLICLLIILFTSQIVSNPSVPYYLIIVFFYSFVAKKPIEYCKSQKNNNKFLYFRCYIIVLCLGAILMCYLGYVGELNVQKCIDTNK